jgi:hypothetical protein
MDGGNEQRVAIKFSFKADLSATETPVLVQKAYRNEALNRSNVCKWYSRFRDGRELVEDDERGGRPKSTRTEVNTAAVADCKRLMGMRPTRVPVHIITATPRLQTLCPVHEQTLHKIMMQRQMARTPN